MKVVKEFLPASNYAIMGWTSHEFNRIIRHAKNLQQAGVESEIILNWIFEQKEVLENENKEIRKNWDEIAEFVSAKDEDGYVEWSKSSYTGKWDDVLETIVRQRFRTWIII